MQTNLLWTGREYYSLENCLVTTTAKGSGIQSVIVGKYKRSIYRVEYHIKTTKNWETVYLDLRYQHSNKKQHILFESDGQGHWKKNGKTAHQFNGCLDVDIPLTPFTNSLPISRLQLSKGSVEEIRVIYIDILAQKITPVRQKYQRLSKNTYHYENIPNDFEADIKVDDLGFVVDYPSLFVRTAALTTNYPKR